MLRAFCLVLSLLVLPLTAAGAEPVANLGANAALKYWQAFATLPPLSDADQTRLVSQCATMPLDGQVHEIVNRSGYALRLMHAGAALPHCAWGLGWEEEGVGLLIPQVKAARVLSAIACLRARERFEAGRPTAAIDDILATLTLGRHLAQESINIMLLMDWGIERSAGDTLTRYLPRLSAEQIKHLQRRLAGLPPAGTAATAIKIEEKCAVDWLVREVKKAKDRERLVALLSEYCGEDGKRATKAGALLEACGGTADGVLKLAEQTRASYQRIAKKLDLPPAEFDKEYVREKAGQGENPLFPYIFPAYDRLRRFQARADIHRALLSAALAVQLDGPTALKNHPDPVVGGSFEYITFKDGFELRSKFKIDKSSSTPLTLTVGQRRIDDK
jgi:hypothetical protein